MPAGSIGLVTVPADSIVKNFYVIEHIRLGILPAGIDVTLDSFFL